MNTKRDDQAQQIKVMSENISIALERALGGLTTARNIVETYGADALHSKLSELSSIVTKHIDALENGNVSGNIEPISETVFDMSQKAMALSGRLTALGLCYLANGMSNAAQEFHYISFTLEAIETKRVKL